MQVDRRCALLSGWAEMCANAPWMELRGGASKSWPVRKIAKPRHTVRRMAAASLPPDSGEPVDAGPRQEEEAGRACMGYPASKERKIAGVGAHRPRPECAGVLPGDEGTGVVDRHDHHDQAAQSADRMEAGARGFTAFPRVYHSTCCFSQLRSGRSFLPQLVLPCR